MNKIKIKDLPLSERPYEKYKKRGESNLSDAELLSIILRTGVKDVNVTQLASEVINLCEKKGGIGYLNRISEAELISVNGIGFVKAAQIKCIAELCRRMWEHRRGELKEYNSPNDIAAFYRQHVKSIDKEEVIILLLDGRNHIICEKKISLGSANSALLSSREVFKEALLYNACGVIVLHNHPSGDTWPSKEDIMITKELVRAGDIIGIPVIDHIILGDENYFSFKEKRFI